MASALAPKAGPSGATRSAPRAQAPAVVSPQLALFGGPHPVVERLRDVDVNTMTPLQALDLLARLAAEARGHM
jgi:hypothetical protein